MSDKDDATAKTLSQSQVKVSPSPADSATPPPVKPTQSDAPPPEPPKATPNSAGKSASAAPPKSAPQASSVKSQSWLRESWWKVLLAICFWLTIGLLVWYGGKYVFSPNTNSPADSTAISEEDVVEEAVSKTEPATPVGKVTKSPSGGEVLHVQNAERPPDVNWEKVDILPMSWRMPVLHLPGRPESLWISREAKVPPIGLVIPFEFRANYDLVMVHPKEARMLGRFEELVWDFPGQVWVLKPKPPVPTKRP